MKKEKDKKKVVVITGASKGIGLATAKYFEEKGFVVYGLSRSMPENVTFKNLTCDVSNSQQVETCIKEIVDTEGQIDVFVNNAGMGISGAIENARDEDIDRIFNINVNSVVKTSRTVLPYLRASRGRLINVGSVAGVIPIPFQTCYSATKSAVETFSIALDNEARDYGVRVSCVRPGDTKTSFTESRVKSDSGENDVYAKRVNASVQKMEKDEKNGVPPVKVSKVIYKCATKKHPPLAITVGCDYKLLCGLAKILPNSLKNKIIKLIYG